jgi:hypothetical protein
LQDNAAANSLQPTQQDYKPMGKTRQQLVVQLSVRGGPGNSRGGCLCTLVQEEVEKEAVAREVGSVKASLPEM